MRPQEAPEQRILLFRKPDLLPLLVYQHLGARTESERAEIELRVVGQFMLAQVRPHPGDQRRRRNRLYHVVVRARIEAAYDVRGRIRGSEHDDWRGAAEFQDAPTQVATVSIGQPDIKQDQVEPVGTDLFQRLRAGRHRHHLEAAVRQMFRQ